MQPVIVTAQQIYDQLVTLTREVQGLSGRIDRLADGQAAAEQRLTEHQADDARRLDDHRDRLRSLERRVWAIPSAGMLVAVAAVVVSVVGLVIA